MANQSGGRVSVRDRVIGMRIALGLLAGVGINGAAMAGSFEQWGISGEYKATLGYAGAMRMEDPDPALIDGPVDPFRTVPPSASIW